MKVMLDTNVLISALVFGGKTRALLEKLVLSDNEILVSEYVRDEFIAKLRQKWPEKSEKLVELFGKMNFNFCRSTDEILGNVRDEKDIPVLSDALLGFLNLYVHQGTVEDIKRAIKISIQTQLAIYDSLIIAAAKSEDCAVVYSEDLNDGQVVDGARPVNPFR